MGGHVDDLVEVDLRVLVCVYTTQLGGVDADASVVEKRLVDKVLYVLDVLLSGQT